jgi:hypothetical protein
MNPNDFRAAVTEFVAAHGGSDGRVRDLYAVRQLLVRVQRTRPADRFRLKGGMFVGAVLGTYLRTTRDADVLAPGHADPDEIRGIFEEAVAVVIDDHVVFSNVHARKAERKVEGYDGVAVTINARVADRAATASVDIGYGDAVVPSGGSVTLRPMLGTEPLVMPAYSIEAFLAEKTETVISGFPGSTERRLKDFYDISELTRSWPDPLKARSSAPRSTLRSDAAGRLATRGCSRRSGTSSGTRADGWSGSGRTSSNGRVFGTRAGTFSRPSTRPPPSPGRCSGPCMAAADSRRTGWPAEAGCPAEVAYTQRIRPA